MARAIETVQNLILEYREKLRTSRRIQLQQHRSRHRHKQCQIPLLVAIFYNCESILLVISMPVPWEALIPFGKPVPMSFLSSDELLSSLGLVTALFGAAGTLLNVSKRAQNQGKVSQVYLIMSPYSFIYPPCASFQHPRYHIDTWEEMLMDRDQRLTGHARKQTVST